MPHRWRPLSFHPPFWSVNSDLYLETEEILGDASGVIERMSALTNERKRKGVYKQTGDQLNARIPRL